MVTLSVLAFLLGAALGLRFRVLILVPAVAVGALAAVAEGLARNDSVMHTLLAAVLTVAGLQLGYLAGVLIRALFARPVSRRASWHRPAEHSAR